MDPHLSRLQAALCAFEHEAAHLRRWGVELAGRLSGGARLITLGNGGSAAHAEHLAAEMVGRYQDERRPFSAVALHVDGASLTALANDYGIEAIFARQVRAHAREGDVVVAFSTSGRSPDVVAAAVEAARIGAVAWAFTGPLPNPLADACTDAIGVALGAAGGLAGGGVAGGVAGMVNGGVDGIGACTPTIQEVHQVCLHMLCEAFDCALSPMLPEQAVGAGG